MTNILHYARSGKPLRGRLALIINGLYNVIVWMKVVLKTVGLSKRQLPTTVVLKSTITQFVTYNHTTLYTK